MPISLRAGCFVVLIATVSGTNTLLAQSQPREVLRQVLESDFVGSSGGRIGKVKYTVLPDDQRWGAPEGFLFLEGSELQVVSSSNIVEENKSSQIDSVFSVISRVCAVTSGLSTPNWISRSGREIAALPAPEFRTQSYHLMMLSGSWTIIDPPAPMVSREALLLFFHFRLERISNENVLRKLREAGGHALEGNAIGRAWVERQIRILEDLDC
jgi:hypothetical protein